MTPEQIRSLRAWSDNPTKLIQMDDLALDISALLAEWEEQKRLADHMTSKMSEAIEQVEKFRTLAEERSREVERLRASTLPDVVPEDVDALKAEIERLKAERDEALAAMSSDGADAVGNNAVLRAEIERLRELLAQNFRDFGREREQTEAQSRARRIAEAEVKRLGAELRVWQECSARQDHELDEAARKLEQAEARLARVVEATLALISAVDAQIKPDKYMVGRLGQARANALAAAQQEEPVTKG